MRVRVGESEKEYESAKHFWWYFECLATAHPTEKKRKNEHRCTDMWRVRKREKSTFKWLMAFGWWKHFMYDFGSPNISSWENWIYVIMIIDVVVVVGVFRLFCLTFSGFVVLRGDRSDFFPLSTSLLFLRFDLSPFRLIIAVNTLHGSGFFCNTCPVLAHSSHAHNQNNMTNGLVGMCDWWQIKLEPRKQVLNDDEFRARTTRVFSANPIMELRTPLKYHKK